MGRALKELTNRDEVVIATKVHGRMHDGPNVPFGQGDTPIREALQLIRDNKWPIQTTIEFEYPVPEGSDRMTELARTVDYCRQALLT